MTQRLGWMSALGKNESLKRTRHDKQRLLTSIAYVGSLNLTSSHLIRRENIITLFGFKFSHKGLAQWHRKSIAGNRDIRPKGPKRSKLQETISGRTLNPNSETNIHTNDAQKRQFVRFLIVAPVVWHSCMTRPFTCPSIHLSIQPSIHVLAKCVSSSGKSYFLCKSSSINKSIRRVIFDVQFGDPV